VDQDFVLVQKRVHQKAPRRYSTKSNFGGGERPKNVGIVGIDVYFPRTYVSQEELEIFDGVSKGKYTVGLGQNNMAFCDDREDISSISMTVVKNLMEKYNNVITLDGLSEMHFLHAAMKETLRLYPPLILLMRKVLEPVEYKGYIVPKGDIAVVCPPVSHRLEKVFSDPDSFNPLRFLGDDAEDIKTKFGFLAFGGGRHQCLGERFGFLQVKTIWSIMCRKFDFELCSAHPKPDYSGIVVGPTQPCKIRYKRKQTPYSFSEKF